MKTQIQENKYIYIYIFDLENDLMKGLKFKSGKEKHVCNAHLCTTE